MINELNLCPVPMKLSIYKNDNHVINLQLTDASETPINITGYTFSLVVAKGTVDIITIAGVITNALTGLFSFTFTSDKWTSIDAGSYYHEISMTASSIKTTLYAGLCDIRDKQ